MNTIQYGNKKINCPESWNDLTKKQLLSISLSISKTVTDPAAENYSELIYASKIESIRSVLKMPWYKYMHVTSGQIAQLFPLVDFLNTIDLDKQLIPSVRVGFKKYYGPSKGLRQSTFGEFIAADTYFGNFINTGDFLHLHKLIACLYRPKQANYSEVKNTTKWNGDIREEFNDNLIASRAECFAKSLPLSYKWAILYFYYGFRNKHVLSFKNIFSKPKKAEDRSGNDYGWAGVQMNLSGKEFGDFDEVAKKNWYTLLVFMSKSIDDNWSKK